MIWTLEVTIHLPFLQVITKLAGEHLGQTDKETTDRVLLKSATRRTLTWVPATGAAPGRL